MPLLLVLPKNTTIVSYVMWFVFGAQKRNLGVNPKGEPGDDDEHAGWDVDGEHVVRELAFENQLDFQARIFSCKRKRHCRLHLPTLFLF